MNTDDIDLLSKGIAVLIISYIAIPTDAVALTIALFQGTYDLPCIMILIGMAPLLIYSCSYAFDKYSIVYVDGYSKSTAKEHKVYKLVNELTDIRYVNVVVLVSGLVLLLIGGLVFGFFHAGLFIVKLAVTCLLVSTMWTIGLNLDFD